jgi:hypothetical protein
MLLAVTGVGSTGVGELLLQEMSNTEAIKK